MGSPVDQNLIFPVELMVIFTTLPVDEKTDCFDFISLCEMKFTVELYI